MAELSRKLALYASYQTGEDLPGYIRFALKHLAETDFKVVLLTNERKLSQATYEFIADNNIELFLTQNRGFDFGMWHRYLKMQADCTPTTPGSGMQRIERLLLLNDSIVYYKNIFPNALARAEESKADAISLTSSTEHSPHLQSFFLYLKPSALGAFYMHLFETPEQNEFYDVVNQLEIGLSEAFSESGVYMDSLYQTERQALFAYKELIAQGAGFVKRKLLQHRFNTIEKKHFVRFKAYDALVADYTSLIQDAGVDADFKMEWLPRPSDVELSKRVLSSVKLNAYRYVGWPLLRTAIKAKYKLLGKPLEGDEYK